jgi:SEC-C motif-containing protein
MSITACRCDSGKPFARCCGPFLSGREQARTPKQLMRSRYTAYALGGHGDYLMKTWHPGTVGPLSAEILDEVTLDWRGLEILDEDQKGDRGRVDFKATYVDEAGNSHVHHEHSAFLRVKGKWLYFEGKMRDVVIQDASA